MCSTIFEQTTYNIIAFIIFLSTIGIETIQYFMGRSTDIDDVIMNFIGGVLGYFIFKICYKIFKKNTKYIHWRNGYDEICTILPIR